MTASTKLITRIVAADQYLILVSGKALVLYSLAEQKVAQIKADAHAALIRSVAVYDNRIVTSGEDKQLKEWSLPNLELLQSLELAKRASDIIYTPNGQHIAVADKHGDVYSYPSILQSGEKVEPLPTLPEPKVPPMTKHVPTAKNPAPKTPIPAPTPKADEEPTLQPMLGHVSMLTALAFTATGDRIVTADRDEHVRISRWPDAYRIEKFLMGQQKFLSALKMFDYNDKSYLISAGGDDFLSIWDLATYELVNRFDITSLKAHNQIYSKSFRFLKESELEIENGKTGAKRKGKMQPQLAREAHAKANGAPVDTTNEQKEIPDVDSVEPALDLTATTIVEVKRNKRGMKSKAIERTLDLLAVTKVEIMSLGNDDASIILGSCGCGVLLQIPLSQALDSTRTPDFKVLTFTETGAPIVDFAINPDKKQIYVTLDTTPITDPEAPIKQCRKPNSCKDGDRALFVFDWTAESLSVSEEATEKLNSAELPSSEKLSNEHVYSLLSMLVKDTSSEALPEDSSSDMPSDSDSKRQKTEE